MSPACCAPTASKRRNLTLEITESKLMTQLERALETLTRLRDIGVGISVDDFGTGYSSLSYLSTLPISSLKVDRSFVNHMMNASQDAEIVRAIVSLGNALGKTVIAEGIESSAQLAQLRARGCRFGQGYFLAAPMPADEALALLHSERLASAQAADDDHERSDYAGQRHPRRQRVGDHPLKLRRQRRAAPSAPAQLLQPVGVLRQFECGAQRRRGARGGRRHEADRRAHHGLDQRMHAQRREATGHVEQRAGQHRRQRAVAERGHQRQHRVGLQRRPRLGAGAAHHFLHDGPVVHVGGQHHQRQRGRLAPGHRRRLRARRLPAAARCTRK